MNVNAIVEHHLARALREIRREKVFYDYVLINDRLKAIIRAAISGATESLQIDLALAQQMVAIESRRANEAEKQAGKR